MTEDNSDNADLSAATKFGSLPTQRSLGLSELGATTIEYGIMAGLLALAIYVGVQISGNGLNRMFVVIGVAVQNAANTAEQNAGN